MKALLVICLVSVSLTLTTAYPRKSYKIVKSQRSKDVTPPPNSGTVTNSGGGGDVAAVLLSKVETTTTVPVSIVPVEPEVVTEKSKLGEKPFGEPTPIPDVSNPSVSPPKQEEVLSVTPVTEAAIEAISAPVSTVAPLPVTAAVLSPPTGTNGTGSEEDDSSSEEDADEGEDDARILISRKKSKSVKMSTNSFSKARAGPSKNPPLKYDLIINGFVTDDGQVLVPINAYQKFFRNAQNGNGSPPRVPPVYAITRQEGSQEAATSVVASEESEDKNSEENAPPPVRNSQTNFIYSEKSKPLSESDTESSETLQETGGSSEEVEKEALSTAGENEEKEKPVESEEKETPSVESEEKPAAPTKIRPIDDTRTPVFRPPPLQALPARLPTNEDDEEEAGRYLDQYGFLPQQFEYDSDEPFHHGISQFEYDDDEPIHHGVNQRNPYYD